MAWIEAFDLAGVDISSPGVADYTRGAIVQWGVGQGWSQNRIEAELRNNGVGLQASVQRNLIQAEQARVQAGPGSAQLGIDYSSGELLAPEPPANWTGQYVHQVTFTTRTLQDDGSYELNDRTVGVKSSIPLTPAQAVNAGFDVISQAPASETGTPSPTLQNVVLSQLTGIWYDTQGRNLPVATRFLA